jgi:hypothetical protein
LDGLCLGWAHLLAVLPVGGGDLVGERKDEIPVFLAFLGGRLALQQGHAVAEAQEPVVPELFGRAIPRVVDLGFR